VTSATRWMAASSRGVFAGGGDPVAGDPAPAGARFPEGSLGTTCRSSGNSAAGAGAADVGEVRKGVARAAPAGGASAAFTEAFRTNESVRPARLRSCTSRPVVGTSLAAFGGSEAGGSVVRRTNEDVRHPVDIVEMTTPVAKRTARRQWRSLGIGRPLIRVTGSISRARKDPTEPRDKLKVT
jgi:hypothetical protein